VAYSVEATGVPEVLRQAVDCLALRGVCGAVGAAPFGAEVHLDMLGLMLGRTVRGIVEGDSVPQIFIPQLLDLHRQGRFPFDRLIRFYPFEEIGQAAAAPASGEVVKPVVVMH
jgi:aryl-alcohol dehydrogenase